MDFKRIAIIGVGLLGGSIGLALKGRSFTGQIIGIGRNERKLREAKALGAIDSYFTDLSSGIKNADLIIICTPVCSIHGIYREIYPLLNKDTIVTDTGSTKHELLDEISAIENKAHHFIGSHPMAGSEKSGIESASSGIFKNSIVAVINDRNDSMRNIKKINSFWEYLGANVINISSKEHDEIVSKTSHMPHIISYLIAYSCMTSKKSEDRFDKLFGKGLLDMTRLSMSNPEMWIDIISTNRMNILNNIKDFKKNILIFEELISNGDYDRLNDLLLRIKEFREDMGSNWI